MSDEKTLLEQLFAVTDDRVSNFMGAINEMIGDPDDVTARVTSGVPEQIAVEELTTQRSGYIQIESGFQLDNYVWHFLPFHPRKPYRVPQDRVIFILAHIIHKRIPQDIQVKIWRPMTEYGIHEITFKAFGLRQCWNVDEKTIEQINLKLFEGLNALV